MICALVMRFSNAGLVCAGDKRLIDDDALNDGLYMTSSGNFLKVYLIILCSMAGCSCCCLAFVMFKVATGDPEAAGKAI